MLFESFATAGGVIASVVIKCIHTADDATAGVAGVVIISVIL